MAADERIGRADVQAPSRTFTLERVTTLFHWSFLLVLAVFGVQSALTAVGDGTVIPAPGGTIAVFAVLAPALGAVIGVLARSGTLVRASAGAFAAIYLLIVLAWPVLVSSLPPHPHPWTWYLASVAAMAALVAWPEPVAVAYAVLASAAVAASQAVHPAITGDGILVAVLDGVYAVFVAGVIVVLWRLFRQSAIAVDDARAAALAEYDEAARTQAVEAERVELDAIVHDTVLSALRAAERAEGRRGSRIAAAMAARAIAVLVARPQPDDQAPPRPMSALELASGLARRARAADPEISVSRSLDADAIEVPRDAGEALLRAAGQALSNSMLHAGAGASRAVRVEADRSALVARVVDDGAGFDPLAVDPRRLGLRVSVIERVVVFGGDVRVTSAPGAGTTVELRWPARDVEEASRG